ncbi:deazaflavin-dependent oxidoreductase, nitroreductase family [Nocardiopsis flavescens]|uniref:Deazaflavin-dependent oxidoreductase, nitroreductase family n=2 Tax=Nocardiopsis flavescens TaxID=758803 RepID=A0A1M6IPI9_9ACTN|nr:deazaflavin-dependent oxidoreductase, nitroreductase family [Nocardiopsis flavescens]
MWAVATRAPRPYDAGMGLLTPLAVRIGALPWLPRLLPQISGLDRGLQRISRGHVGVLDLAGLPNLMLTVTGRISGKPRSTPLLYVRDGAHLLIAGSSFGAPRTPAWAHNLRDAETALVEKSGRRVRVRAQELTSRERDRAWSLMCHVWPNFALYEQRADRLIPVFRLTPVHTR